MKNKRQGNYIRGQQHHKYKHGQYGTPLYICWRRMKQRCLDKNDKRYPRYGGRGITVCDKWLEFEGFVEDMGDSWFKGASLERNENDGNYEKSNVRWIPMAEQAKNRKDTVHIEWQGRTMCMADWERELGFKKGTIRMRLRYYGWSVEQALTIKANYANDRRKM